MDKKRTGIAIVALLLVVGFAIVSLHKDWISQQFTMEMQEYDNGQGSVFAMQFYKDAKIIPATQREMSFDPEHPPQGNIITQQHSDAGLTISIGKANEMDPEVQKYCSEMNRNPFAYIAKANGNRVPVCVLGLDETEQRHALYLTKVEGKSGRHLVQIYKDFDTSEMNDEEKKALADTLDLNHYRADILYILSSIEER